MAYSPVVQKGRVRVATGILTYASQSAGAQTFDVSTTAGPLRLPVGAVVVGGFISTSVTTGSATIALGITGSTDKYRAAGAITTAGANPIVLPHAAFLATPLTAEENVFVTTASAALPASGSLKVELHYVVD